jgi:hypothetical protein
MAGEDAALKTAQAISDLLDLLASPIAVTGR